MAKKEAAVAPAEPKAPRVRKAKEPQACKCGCGEMTKGGMFRPGHDARYHSALAKEQAAAAAAEAPAEPETAETFSTDHEGRGNPALDLSLRKGAIDA